ncbi:DUF3105 domain-containing protein [Salirhabdus salicampi]|uniref:DUF3105 domain-containing protein n=1 Tax=Salirhabdus salicampi TaxID=476102 RepID=UPI0020C5A4D0|nr:DUF3105 domain-containing protein [Salirhabdus salicampi]MCP8615283.1 DUF3105 domain-containing protein [Salirhabdus salicampi]
MRKLTLLFMVVLLSACSDESIEGVESFDDDGNEHLQDVSDFNPNDYSSDPPTSGPHMGNLVKAGYYEEIIPDPYLIHNLEDGYIVIYYNEGSIGHIKEDLQQLAEESKGHSGVVVVPRSGIEEEVILTAWTKMLRMNDFDREKAEQFIKKYIGIDHH